MAAKTTDFDRLLENMKGKHARRFDAALEVMDEEQFTLNYIKLLEFSSPKLQRTDMNFGGEVDNTINIIHTHNADKIDGKGED